MLWPVVRHVYCLIPRLSFLEANIGDIVAEVFDNSTEIDSTTIDSHAAFAEKPL